MKTYVLAILTIHSIYSFAYAYSPLEPSLECTVIKVISTQQLFGIKNFPKLYLSINNNPQSSKLIIGKKELLKIDPISVAKTETYEKILIKQEADQLVIELAGKPVSRIGTMTINGKLAAELTCH